MCSSEVRQQINSCSRMIKESMAVLDAMGFSVVSFMLAIYT